MSLGSDPYEVLGVPRDASDDQIAQARRRLSRAYHPDVNPAPDAAARFDEVQQAYHLLSGAGPAEAWAGGEQGRAHVIRDPGGGHGSATEAASGIFESREPAMPRHLQAWLLVVVFALIFLVYIVVTTR
jgi:DnaJ-class molecular chaperone